MELKCKMEMVDELDKLNKKREKFQKKKSPLVLWLWFLLSPVHRPFVMSYLFAFFILLRLSCYSWETWLCRF